MHFHPALVVEEMATPEEVCILVGFANKISFGLEAIAVRLEAIAIRLEAVAIMLITSY